MNRKLSSAMKASLLMRYGLVLLVLLTTFDALAAQEGSDTRPAPVWRNSDKSRTIDDLRKLNRLVRDDSEIYGAERVDRRAPKPPIQVLNDERDRLRTEIERRREELRDPKADPVWVEEQLASALASYFITDLKCRVMELDEIKAKLAETEAKLQKRLSAKVETVDLQLQIMLREAAGLGFFPKDDATSSLNSVPGPVVLGAKEVER